MELVRLEPSERLTWTYGMPWSSGMSLASAVSQQTVSRRLATDCGDSTSKISAIRRFSFSAGFLSSILRYALYLAGPRSAKPVGWNRSPWRGLSRASISKRGAPLRVANRFDMGNSPLCKGPDFGTTEDQIGKDIYVIIRD